MPTTEKKKFHIGFLPALAIFAFVTFIRHFKFSMSTYNTTFLALNYDYGYIPRGFIGTLYQKFVESYEIISHDYLGAFNFSGLFTLFYFLLLFGFYKVCLKQSADENQRNLKHLIIFISIFAFPMFTTRVSYGCLDLYLNLCMVLAMVLLVKGRLEWLVIPLGVIGVCINQDFVYTNANLIVVLLLYKLLISDNKKKIAKYLIILALFLASIHIHYEYFENYTYENSTEMAKEIKESAKLLSESGKGYGKTYVKSEILGEDLSETEEYMEQKLDNEQDLPVFCVLFAPYIIFGVRFFIKLMLDKSATWRKRLAYLILLLGGCSMIHMLKTDIYYGRYMFQLVFYYVAVIICMLAMNDSLVENGLNTLKAELKKITPLTAVWFLYPLLLVPFRAVAISASIHDLAEIYFTPELSFFLQQVP